jgi:hypothetical protein
VKGGFFHNRCLVGRLIQPFRDLGATVLAEHRIESGRHGRAVDLLVQLGPYRIVVEAERDLRRLSGDVAKARALGANLLLVVVPTGRLARTARCRLAVFQGGEGGRKPRIMVLTLGAALELVTNRSPLKSAAFVGEDPETSIPGPPGKTARL